MKLSETGGDCVPRFFFYCLSVFLASDSRLDPATDILLNNMRSKLSKRLRCPVFASARGLQFISGHQHLNGASL